jgi:hypothetical protein
LKIRKLVCVDKMRGEKTTKLIITTRAIAIAGLLAGLASLSNACAKAAVTGAGGDSDTDSDSDSDSDSDTDSDSDSDSDTDSDSDSDTSTDTDSESGPDTDNTCGDGEASGDEECDDGNDGDGDGCEDCVCVPAQALIDIPFTSTTGWLSTGCCNELHYRVANNGDVLSAQFDDPLPENTVPTAVEIQAGVRHACNTETNALEFEFNDVVIGTWNNADGPHCNCGNPAIALASFPAEASDYLVGAPNSVAIDHNAIGDCHEAVATVPSTADGTAFHIVVDFEHQDCAE